MVTLKKAFINNLHGHTLRCVHLVFVNIYVLKIEQHFCDKLLAYILNDWNVRSSLTSDHSTQIKDQRWNLGVLKTLHNTGHGGG